MSEALRSCCWGHWLGDSLCSRRSPVPLPLVCLVALSGHVLELQPRSLSSHGSSSLGHSEVASSLWKIMAKNWYIIYSIMLLCVYLCFIYGIKFRSKELSFELSCSDSRKEGWQRCVSRCHKEHQPSLPLGPWDGVSEFHRSCGWLGTCFQNAHLIHWRIVR